MLVFAYLSAVMIWHWEAVKDFGMAFNENDCAVIVPFSLFILLKITPLIEMSTVIVKSKSFAVFEVMMKCYLFFSFFIATPTPTGVSSVSDQGLFSWKVFQWQNVNHK